MNKDKKQLIILLIELNLLLDLFLFDNINIKNKTQELIIILIQLDKKTDFTKILNYNKNQLKYFCEENINNLLKDF